MFHRTITELAREQVFLISISFAAFATGPAIVHAQARQQQTTSFSDALDLSRGRLLPGSPEAVVLSRNDYCHVMIHEWGWETCDGVDAMVVSHLPGIGITVIETPNSQGFVTFDDWQREDRDTEIGKIEAGLRASIAGQAQRTGDDIQFVGWRTYPTLNEENGYLYYATDVTWNGARETNVEATVFDRRGYVVFTMSPESADLSSDQIEELINLTLNRYIPAPEQGYSAFVSGDKVASVGALGVLAGMVGVKYGKSAGTGIAAMALLVIKKAWFVLLLPLVWLKRLFR